MAVVAIALAVGATVAMSLVRNTLQDGIESSAEREAESLADRIERDGVGALPRSSDSDEEDDDPEDLVWQVIQREYEQGEKAPKVLAESQPLGRTLPGSDQDETIRLPGADSRYLVVVESSGDRGQYIVSVAASLEDVDDTTSALLPVMLVGLPLLVLLVGATTWLLVGGALRPVERIRREVADISDANLEQRVELPEQRDEIRRLAATMNQMLARLEAARDRQRQFVGDASHELRSPLASMRQTAEVAKAHPGALPEGELADAVLEEGARMQRLVEQLLVLTRTDEGAVALGHRDVDLDDHALAEARRVRNGLEIDTFGVQGGRVRGDRAALSQVVRNLVDNAVRHARSRVVIGVHQDECEGEPEGEPEGGPEGGHSVELVVEDDGPGVPEGQRERVFERFVRLDEARARDAGGSGLGLAIVREIVRAHGGSVSVSASVSGGARFVVRLPGGGA